MSILQIEEYIRNPKVGEETHALHMNTFHLSFDTKLKLINNMNSIHNFFKDKDIIVSRLTEQELFVDFRGFHGKDVDDLPKDIGECITYAAKFGYNAIIFRHTAVSSLPKQVSDTVNTP